MTPPCRQTQKHCWHFASPIVVRKGERPAEWCCLCHEMKQGAPMAEGAKCDNGYAYPIKDGTIVIRRQKHGHAGIQAANA